MRNLTQQEIDDAPSWATHYVITINNYVIYESSQLFFSSFSISPAYNKGGIGKYAKPIPRTEFDVSEYEFSDGDIKHVEIDGYANNEYLHFGLKQEVNELTHSKADVIAMVKALKITWDDLK